MVKHCFRHRINLSHDCRRKDDFLYSRCLHCVVYTISSLMQSYRGKICISFSMICVPHSQPLEEMKTLNQKKHHRQSTI